MREFILYIDTCEIGVYQKGYYLWDSSYHNEKLNKKYSFASYCVKDGLIMSFFDIVVYDEMIQAAKNDKLMQEVCEFEVLINDTFKETFKGTFVDALIYIKENYKGQ